MGPTGSRKYAVLYLMATFALAVPNRILCGQYDHMSDQSNKYRFSNNIWGRDSSGASCIEVTNNATSLSTTWSWKANETLVHAYPNINFNPVQDDPIQISNLASIDVKVSWSMRPALSRSVSAFDKDGLGAIKAKTNVAFDVFFDTEIEYAINTTAPRYEVMVWIGQYGSILPIGAWNNDDMRKLPKQKVGKETFTLYQGPNDNGQHVFSWVAGSDHTDFEGDISPLIHYLWRSGLVLATNYIGVIQFGTEQKHATSNVTFSVDSFALDATKGVPKEASGMIVGCPRWGFIAVVMVVTISWLI